MLLPQGCRRCRLRGGLPLLLLAALLLALAALAPAAEAQALLGAERAYVLLD